MLSISDLLYKVQLHTNQRNYATQRGRWIKFKSRQLSLLILSLSTMGKNDYMHTNTSDHGVQLLIRFHPHAIKGQQNNLWAITTSQKLCSPHESYRLFQQQAINIFTIFHKFVFITV